MASPATAPAGLSAEINAATRSVHTQLNRLITSRLPLCLPPHVSDPRAYTAGLQHFAHVFLTFESLWHDLTNRATHSVLLQSLLEDPWVTVESSDAVPGPAEAQNQDTKTADPFSFSGAAINPKTIPFLANLRPSGLARSKRLRADIAALTNSTANDASTHFSRFPGAAVQDYCSHIRHVVTHRPHVLVAYAWCYYMAVFSGGRWIRAQLQGAGADFWSTETGSSAATGASKNDSKESSQSSPIPYAGLSFFHFPGDQDGEDIKGEFKRRLEAADTIFTPWEKQDIINEAIEIFKRSESLVLELDSMFGTEEKLSAVTVATAAIGSSKKQEASTSTTSSPHPAGPASGTMAKRLQHVRNNAGGLYSATGVAIVASCIAAYTIHYFSAGSLTSVAM